MNIINVKSMHPMTEFSPSWNFSIGTDVWNYDKIDIIEKWLIDNEERIKNLYPPQSNDGGTGLGKNSLTSRFGKYNLFKFADELPELNDLFKFIQVLYLDYLKHHNGQLQDLYIVCWYNVLRKDEKIDEHSHGVDPFAYLSGNFHLNNYETKTYYRCPIDREVILPLDNSKGGISIFPGFVPHYTDTHKKDCLRVSIGFDLHINKDPTALYNKNISLDFIQFMNTTIYQSIISEIE